MFKTGRSDFKSQIPITDCPVFRYAFIKIPAASALIGAVVMAMGIIPHCILFVLNPDGGRIGPA
ncbi:hypothetical protein SDC9_120955 [bioreactor metagenome]|uniref:Uncharacterized protein n=1 Tax=bioreactor metagenome TaxID=1076179 RepID=A0A645CAL7_9ZZZZ